MRDPGGELFGTEFRVVVEVVLLHDDFSDRDSGWVRGGAQRAGFDYRGGEYLIMVAMPGWLSQSLAPIEMPADFWGPKVDKKEEERENNGLASPTQISALKQIYNTKVKREKLFRKLNNNGKYKKKITDFKEIKEDDARKAITEAQQTNELIK